MDDLPPVSVQFKIEPIHIPATNITRDDKFPTCRGGLADIWKCSMTTQSGTPRLVAVKSVRVPSATDATSLQAIGKRVRREAYVWIKLKHDHILPLDGVIEEFGPLPALVSPWMKEGSLNDYLKREFSGLSDPRKQELVWQVTAGISYLHSEGIVHGDLTATNVLVDSCGCLRLADFGLSMILAEEGNATFNSCHAGNVRWMPPEALRAGDEHNDEAKDEKPTKAWDVYSYGCVVFQIFSGNQPYAWIPSVLQVMGAMQKGREPFKGIESHEAYQRFSPCLNKISANRPTMDNIMEVLQEKGVEKKEGERRHCILTRLKKRLLGLRSRVNLS
ncbi:kinase-like domain-containing protein [Suillus bovinus]|uniref:kinase-like domain-containing protein n=1 Tax=Suillus bovinus TaxID=48563 RepID=UPI001B85ECA1|nr:kinase-like domain-containing protein [Suillus bovinus]KAG2140917.1 kinase-like domain-containing protein [Suillus bovinus]